MNRKNMTDRELLKRYPFLWPRNAWTMEKIPEDKYDGNGTLLDQEIPEGWKNLVLDMCEEIRNELVKYNCLDDYAVVQAKEKFAELRWYDHNRPKDSEIGKIIEKYTAVSEKTCAVCGKPAVFMSKGYILPYCRECAEKSLQSLSRTFKKKDLTNAFTPIEETE